MSRREFIDCLNSEPKAFNCNLGSLAGGVVMLVLFGFAKGLFWGLGFGAIGFTVGGWISRQWFLGKLQRTIYWKLPLSKVWLDKNAPLSSTRTEL
jgi:hypothetical protein